MSPLYVFCLHKRRFAWLNFNGDIFCIASQFLCLKFMLFCLWRFLTTTRHTSGKRSLTTASIKVSKSSRIYLFVFWLGFCAFSSNHAGSVHTQVSKIQGIGFITNSNVVWSLNISLRFYFIQLLRAPKVCMQIEIKSIDNNVDRAQTGRAINCLWRLKSNYERFIILRWQDVMHVV